METTDQQLCKQLGHMPRAKDRLKQSLDTVRCFPTRYPGGCRAFAICVTRAELDATWQSATEGDYACLITFPRGSPDVKPWRRCTVGLRHSPKIEAQAQGSSFKNVATLSTNSSCDAFMRQSIDEFASSDDIDINGDKPL